MPDHPNWRQIAARATDRLEHGAATVPPPPDHAEHQMLVDAQQIVDEFVESADHRRALVYALIVHARENPSVY